MDRCGFNFFTGLIAGALTGAATMLLLAPKSGAETRADIKNKYGELNEKTKAEFEKMKVKVEELSQKGKEKCVEAKEKCVEAKEKGKAKLESIKEKGMKQANEMGEDLKSVNKIEKK